MTDRNEKRQELARLLLGTEDHYSMSEVINITGVDPGFARKLWRSIGLPETGDDKAYGEPDIAALNTILSAINLEIINEKTLIKLTRALGTTMARLADWEVSTLASEIEAQVDEGKIDNRLDGALDLAKTVTPAFDGLLLYVWRRHLAAAVMRMEALGAGDDDLHSAELTVGFADLVRFTKLSSSIDDIALGQLVEEFESVANDVISSSGSRVIKTLGDAVLFVSPDANTAVDTALTIISQFSKSDSLPDVRVGLATGSVISRLGDVFGTPVNLAARLTSVARRNRVITDRATAERLGEQFETRVLPARPINGFGKLEPVTVRRRWAYSD